MIEAGTRQVYQVGKRKFARVEISGWRKSVLL